MKKLFAVIFAAALGVCGITASAEPYMDEYEVMMPDELKGVQKDKNITREEFCGVIYNLLQKRDIAPEKSKAEFADTENEKVGALYRAGIIEGYDENTFGAADFLTREQAATIICRAMDYMGIEDNEQVSGSFKDNALISPWAAEAVERVGRNGIMHGYGEDRVFVDLYTSGDRFNNKNRFTLENSDFGPQNNYTREQAAITAYRIYTKQPVYTGNEQKWDIEDGIVLFMNEYTTWTEINGEITFCTGTDGTDVRKTNEGIVYEKPLAGKIKDGEYGIAVGEDLYSIESGKYIMGFYVNICEFNEFYVAVETERKVTIFPEVYTRYYYDYSGNIVTYKSSGGSFGEDKKRQLETYKDKDGKIHYMYPGREENEGKMIFSKANSLEKAFSYKYIENCGNDLFITRTTYSANGYEGNYECAIYTADGTEIYKGEQRAFVISKDFYAVCNSLGDGMKLYRIKDNGYLSDIKGKHITKTNKKDYFMSGSSHSENNNYYTFDGKIKLEGCSSININKVDGKECIIAVKDGRSKIYRQEDHSLYLELNGEVSRITEGYIVSIVKTGKTGERHYYSHRGKLLYKSDLDDKVKEYAGDFILFENGRIYNVKTAKSLETGGNKKIFVYDNIVCVIDHNGSIYVRKEYTDVVRYDENLNVMPGEVVENVFVKDLIGKYLCVINDKDDTRHFYNVITGKIERSFAKVNNFTVYTIGNKTYIEVPGFYIENSFTLYDMDNINNVIALPGDYYGMLYNGELINEYIVMYEEEIQEYAAYDENLNFVCRGSYDEIRNKLSE